MANCTSPPESGCYFNTSQESLSTCWNAGGAVTRILGCADGPKFFCVGNASAISTEAHNSVIDTDCVQKSSGGASSAAPQGRISSWILAFLMFMLATAGLASAQVDGPTFSDLKNTTYGDQTAELASFLLGADSGDVLVIGNAGFTVVESATAGNFSSRYLLQEVCSRGVLPSQVDDT